MFQWPKYGRVDGAPPVEPSARSHGFQWPKYGRVDGACSSPPATRGSSTFQWPKYGRVDGAKMSGLKDPARFLFQWPKYGRVDGAEGEPAKVFATDRGFNGRSMAGSMVPRGDHFGGAIRRRFQWPKYGRVDGAARRSFRRRIRRRFQWPKYGRVDGALAGELGIDPVRVVSMAEVWPGRWCLTLAEAGVLASVSFNGRSMAGSMVPGARVGTGMPQGVSMAEVWPGRWCLALAGRGAFDVLFQWPKYGRVDGARWR